MKKILILLAAFLYQSMLFLPLAPTATLAEEEYYAKILDSGVYFYGGADSSSALFELPQSYFVKLTRRENDSFYKASYLDLDGYVKICEVSPMSGVPQNPYPEAYLRVFATGGLGLYVAPKMQTAGLIVTVPYLTSSVVYYGATEGESIPNKSNIWYYCKYSEPAGDYLGYLYSVFCDELTNIAQNLETFPLINSTLFQSSESAVSAGLSDTAKTFIILGVSLPCALVIYLLIKPTMSGQIIKPKKKHKRRHGDYFEFDENDLN